MTAAADIEALWHTHRKDVRNYIGYRVDRDLVDDILQDVYLRALSALSRGAAYPDKPLSWLYRIAHNLVIDYYRQRSKGLEVIDIDDVAYRSVYGTVYDGNGANEKADIIVSPELSPQEQAERAITCQCVHQAIDRLTNLQAHVIVKRMEGYEYAEIGAEMGRSAVAVKQLQLRGCEGLRSMLAEVA